MKRRLLLAAALLACACGRGREEGKAFSLETVKRAADAAGSADHAPVPPIAAEALLAFLPAVPAGWSAEPGVGAASREGRFPLSTARRTYRGPGTLEVTITDSGYQPMVLMNVTMAAQLAKETPQGYERGVLLDGCPGVERWRRDGTNAELVLVVAKRYLVALKATRVPEGFLREVWRGMDRAGLASLS